jgi:hypothetical protein
VHVPPLEDKTFQENPPYTPVVLNCWLNGMLCLHAMEDLPSKFYYSRMHTAPKHCQEHQNIMLDFLPLHLLEQLTSVNSMTIRRE